MHLNLHKRMSNQEIADVFKFISGVLALQNANRFRVRAYDNAASVVAALEEPLYTMFLSNPEFADLPGIGETLETKLTELFTTGNIKAFQSYVAELPGGMFALAQVHGIGVKKAHKLCSYFHLDNPDTALNDVLQLAKEGKIRNLEGFGEKSEQELITQITSHSSISNGRIPYAQAAAIASDIITHLKTCPEVTAVAALGSLRRHATTVGDIDIGVQTISMGPVKNCVKQMKNVKRMSVAGDNLIRIFLDSGHQIDIKAATKEEWGAFLQHYTGSKEHNIKLREFALKKKLSLSEHGIKDQRRDDYLHTFTTEEDFYAFLGLKWIKPEKRLGDKEIEAALIH